MCSAHSELMLGGVYCRFTITVAADGRQLYACGMNESCQLGHGDDDPDSPTEEHLVMLNVSDAHPFHDPFHLARLCIVAHDKLCE